MCAGLAVADYLEEVTGDSEDGEDITRIIEGSFLDPDWATKWKPYRIELIKNKHLESEYEGKKYYFCILGLGMAMPSKHAL